MAASLMKVALRKDGRNVWDGSSVGVEAKKLLAADKRR
jgi:hypothetical protein